MVRTVTPKRSASPSAVTPVLRPRRYSAMANKRDWRRTLNKPDTRLTERSSTLWPESEAPMQNALNWFEIPAANLDRAVKFYEGMLGQGLQRETFDGKPHAIFKAEPPALSGALVQDASRKPSGDGALLYLNVEGKLDACLQRTPSSGGQIILARTGIGEHGFIGIVRDSEGNTIGLHSMV